MINELSIEVEAMKQNFFNLSMVDKIKFMEYLFKDQREIFEYAQLDHGQRKVWNHYYSHCSQAEGYYTGDKSSGSL